MLIFSIGQNNNKILQEKIKNYFLSLQKEFVQDKEITLNNN
jgi:hypothetical protein